MNSTGDSVELKLNRVKIEGNNLELKNLECLIEFFARHRIRELDAPIFDKGLNFEPLQCWQKGAARSLKCCLLSP